MLLIFVEEKDDRRDFSLLFTTNEIVIWFHFNSSF